MVIVPIEDTHEFIIELEKNGELKRVKTEVDSNLEIAEILRREMYSNGSAILFENVKGYDMPALGNDEAIFESSGSFFILFRKPDGTSIFVISAIR